MKYLPTTVCFVAAAYLAAHGIDGWGWFLFIGVILV
ncbi:hypothetical protein CFSAN001690_17040 [Salmonella enterica subsp. enterica serovar Cerro str. CFSAN001690]|nr:hypothetical protein SEEN199_17177 [Salmonella enterica subsp. enterica serovar Newport str. CVM 35199]ETB75610.1 hypothetical protein CFSAN001691_15205 [Salmonella enterica subsp. enterica serovar Cerro str. CFSAN001691]ETB80719.1 hypothetical protein CFSAN001680_14470 [Salmonella enterica subsp. enterica serovar Cerro str. CFSAN001680]ETB86456.1 hypothetical protein CFSAN001690_17040 [Salmonella enterica subsp. enterica serovar Cerro str. CFSAN001690]ETB93316.1 hypothetical protein CFSAN00